MYLNLKSFFLGCLLMGTIGLVTIALLIGVEMMWSLFLGMLCELDIMTGCF